MVCCEQVTDARDTLLSWRSFSHRMAASSSVLLTELLLMFAAADLSGHYGCFGRADKAYGELWCVSRRPRTPEIRCFQDVVFLNTCVWSDCFSVPAQCLSVPPAPNTDATVVENSSH